MRTVKNFVKDSRERGRTREEIRGIAQSTQWSDRIKEVLEEFDKQEKKT